MLDKERMCTSRKEAKAMAQGIQMKKPNSEEMGKTKHRIEVTTSKKCRTRYVWLNVLPDDLWLRVCEGDTVWDALQERGVDVGGECGGLGKCGKCKIKVLSSVGPPTKEEESLLDEEELEQGIRLACRTILDKDLVIQTGEAESTQEYFQILKSGHRPLFHLDPLIGKRLIALPPELQNEGVSDLDRIKIGTVPEHEHLKASVFCLRTLPEMLRNTPSQGVAVLDDNRLLAWQEPWQLSRHYGLVFDLGTSTLVGKLISLVDGTEVAVASCLNSQTKYGTDVISRLQYVKDYVNGLKDLHYHLVEDMNQLTSRLLKAAALEPNEIFVVVAAGNTTMQHLLLSLNPSGIAEAPFSPVLTDGLVTQAADVGLGLHPAALLYVMPMRSGYIGGDLIGVILASGAAEQEEEIILALDIGTNGEIFLGNRRRLMTCSAPAGPAFEGARISHGMIASIGAIEAVGFDIVKGEVHYQVIGNVRPKGVCGSGLVDLVAGLVELGIIDEEGLIRPAQGGAAEGLNWRVIERSGAYDFLIASAAESYDHRPIYLTQRDIREVQLAKGAMAAGIKTLMDEMGVGVEDIGHVYLAGALGNYVNPYSAMRIGLIPRFDRNIIMSLGNAASTGASMVLLSKDYWHKANELAHSIEHVELSNRLDFNEYFVEHMDFPKEEALDIHREKVAEVMRTTRVVEVMTPDFPTISYTTAVKEIGELSRSTGHHGFPVLDEEGHLFGVVTLADLESCVQSGNCDLPVGNIAAKALFVAYPDQSLYEVLQAATKDYGRIPVVDSQDKGHLIGVLRRQDIIQAYRRRALQTSRAGGGFS
jgi:uncharacterized 2Fe-2S/4Fe-4S cluster protein (DUF4445 family)